MLKSCERLWIHWLPVNISCQNKNNHSFPLSLCSGPRLPSGTASESKWQCFHILMNRQSNSATTSLVVAGSNSTQLEEGKKKAAASPAGEGGTTYFDSNSDELVVEEE
ncbi:hypothetical protein PIB30_046946 [Stylosanthes scabra]|uniref:Uncharacterized protein n=1 Tax=Stylosanthes scabra TaxID=79078 RepID=A0ABU6QGA8_9FABA|nr:hypothetical protein [Stylosanthes scabra]